jgi:predicted enzyme related to lactoylglutathione lyase
MGERTSYPHGTFSWVDLATTDQQGVKPFYERLFGWEYEDMPAGEGVVYTMARLDGQNVGAISPLQEDERAQGIPPHWNSYITVDDVDAVAGRVEELGGRLYVPPFDVLDVGRMAVLADPTGAVVCLWQPRRHIGAGVVNVPGALSWNELATRDPQAAQDFYSALLGWEFSPSEQSAGPPYWMVKNGDRWNAGMRELGADAPAGVPAHWLVYFAVASAADAVEKASGAGGQVIVPRTEMGPRAFAVLGDPKHAIFAVFEGDLDD